MCDPAMADPATKYYTIPSFTFTNGTTLANLKVAYKDINPSSSEPAVLIPTCYGGFISHTDTFTETTAAGTPGPLASNRVIVVGMLGFGESDSRSTRPNDFPMDLDYRDNINAQHSLLTQHLGINHLKAVIGFSMGGQQAYYWAAMYPTFLDYAIPVCSSARTSPHNIAFLEGPVSALINSTDYHGGEYRSKGVKPERGLKAFGRAYCAWLTSAEWFRRELWKVSLEDESKTLEDWLETFSSSNLAWDAEDHVVLARMWQKGDIGIFGKGGMEGVLRDVVKAKVLVMPGTTDQYFRVEDGEAEAKALGEKGVFAPIESCWGHVAGCSASKDDLEWMTTRIGKFLKDGT
ncbi:MAG: hypothetical protein Q9160_003181 [Pyrenula sp. 1 TL-2023]